jgi:hypothetical protein
MHVPINVKSPNNISKWQMGFNSAFKRLIGRLSLDLLQDCIKPRRSLNNVAGVQSCFGQDGFPIPAEDVDGSPFCAFGKVTLSIDAVEQ